MAKIYLSPSTQEKNIGALNYGSEEKRMNELADIVEKKLKEYGHTVFRNSPEMTLSQIKIDSNTSKVDVHIALHTNAFNTTVRGCEIWCHKFGGEGEKLSRHMYKYLEALTPVVDRGVKQGFNRFGDQPIYELAYTNAPASLIEVDFHDNVEGAKWLMANMNLIAVAIVEGINDYFGVSRIETEIIDYKKLYLNLCKSIETLYNITQK